MQKLEHLVLAYDSLQAKDPIPPCLLELARAHGASLHVVHVTPSLDRMRRVPKGINLTELEEAWRRSLTDQLNEIAERAEDIELTVAVRSGEVVPEILRYARECKSDLIAVIDEPARREHRRSFGSTTMRLFRSSELPIWAIRAGSSQSLPKRILACIDVPPNDDSRSADTVLEHAQHLSRGAKIEVLHVWSLWGEEMLRTSGRARPEEVDDIVSELHDDVEAEVLATCKRHSALRDPEIHLVKGAPRRVIPSFARSHECDLVVMGSVSRTGLPGLVIGNTAEKILSDLECSVLVTKPPGFQLS